MKRAITTDFTITQDTRFVAVYEIITLSVTPTTGANGTISPSTVQTVDYGSDITFTFTPSANYVVDTVKVNNSAVSVTGNTYTVSNVTQDTTIAVTYKLKAYTVEWKNYDGSIIKTETVQHGQAATPPANPTKPNSTFTGWDKAYNNITADTVITAQFDSVQYTVTFVDHDGSTIKTEQVDHGGTATPPNDPSRPGYTFTGWEKQ